MEKITKAWRCDVCHFKIYTSDNRKPLQVIWENDWGQDFSKWNIHACNFKEVDAADSLRSDEIAIERASNILDGLNKMLDHIERFIELLRTNPKFMELLHDDADAREQIDKIAILRESFKQN